MSRKPRAGTAGNPITIRATNAERRAWEARAMRNGHNQGMGVSGWIVSNSSRVMVPLRLDRVELLARHGPLARATAISASSCAADSGILVSSMEDSMMFKISAPMSPVVMSLT